MRDSPTRLARQLRYRSWLQHLALSAFDFETSHAPCLLLEIYRCLHLLVSKVSRRHTIVDLTDFVTRRAGDIVEGTGIYGTQC